LYGVWERIARGGPRPWVVSPVASEDLPVTVLWVLTAIPIVAVTLWTTRGGERSRDVDRAFLLVNAAALLVSPLGWSYYYWLLAGPLVAIGVGPGWRQLSGGARTLMCVSVPGLLCPSAMLDGGQPSAVATLTIGSLYVWSLAAIWGAALLARPAASVNPR
jgi:hypothetical protein